MSQRKYLLKRSPPDHRDFKLKNPSVEEVEKLPEVFDLRDDADISPSFPHSLDQQRLGACLFNAGSNALKYLLEKEKVSVFQPSRLYLYWNTRVNVEHGPANEDTGACVRDLCKGLSKYHACNEEIWPYDISKFSEAPPLLAYKDANIHKKIQYHSIPLNLNAIKHAVFQRAPILIGIQIYESFESLEVAKTGLVPIPDIKKENQLGGHALLLIGWNDHMKCFIIQNSWGVNWGSNGCCFIPYDYILNPELAGDFWQITLFE